MKRDTSYRDFVVYDLMATLPDITSRGMMGGFAIYSEGTIFAMIIRNQLYLKAEGTLAEKLEAEGWTTFSYERAGGKVVSMKYWLVPEELIDNPHAFGEKAREVLAEI